MNGPEVVLEMEAGILDEGWLRLGGQSVDEPPGSLTNYSTGVREILIFGWHEGQRGVWRSLAGVDTSNIAVRTITSLGFELLSDLSEPYEMVFAPSPDSPGRTIRFRVLEAL